MATTDVRAAEPRRAPLTETAVSYPVSYVDWGAIVAGAVAAAALAFVLHSFGVAVGLALSSTAPTWRDASFALVALSGLYLVLVAQGKVGSRFLVKSAPYTRYVCEGCATEASLLEVEIVEGEPAPGLEAGDEGAGATP